MFRNSNNLQQDLFNDQIAYVESLWSWELFRKKLRPFIIRSIQSFSFEITKEKKYYFRNDIVLHCYLSKRMNKSVLRYKINQIPDTSEMLLEIFIVSWNWKKRGGGLCSQYQIFVWHETGKTALALCRGIWGLRSCNTHIV